MTLISMSPLTGTITGSNRVDEISSEIDRVDPAWNSVIPGIVDATINSLDGRDAVEGAVTLLVHYRASSYADVVTAIGMANSAIDAGNGEDTIAGSGTVIGEFNVVQELASIPGPHSLEYSTGGLKSYGGAGLTTVNGGNGADAIAFDSSATMTITGNDPANALPPFLVNASTQSYGVGNANLYGGAGADTLTITSNSAVIANFGNEGWSFCGASSYAAIDSIINGDAGADVITLTGTATVAADAIANYYGSNGVGIMRTTVMGGNGNDVITVGGTSIARIIGGQSVSSTSMSASGVVGGSVIDGGNGNDTISVTGMASVIASSFMMNLPTARGYGIVGGTINGGNGNDAIAIEGTGYHDGYGVQDSTINGGTGDDTIEITGTSNYSGYSGNYSGYGVTDATVDGSDGDDTIKVTATGKNGIGAHNSFIYGGNGRDIIEISGIGASSGVGVAYSTVDGGSGSDTILVSGSTNGIQAATILGGDGNDYIDVGMGSGTIDGGRGRDLVNLDFFDPATMTIAPNGAGGIHLFSNINDTFTNQPLWSQDILNVERFQLGGETYTVNRLLRTTGSM